MKKIHAADGAAFAKEGARSSSAARFLDCLLDTFPDRIKRLVPIAVTLSTLTPFGQRIEPMKKFAIVLEIYLIKNCLLL
jgi:hypothetical protein